MNQELILASESQYKKNILKRLEIAFSTDAPAIDETPQEVADREGVSVSYLLRAAGTAVAGNPEWVATALGSQAERDSQVMAGAAIPRPDTDN